MRKSEKFLWAAAFLCIGMVAGFLIAPIKAGIVCGDGNTVYTGPGRSAGDDGAEA
ncbi:hypothetical protein [uncultured Anaerotruncus sp.]|uniref:hypothetical protein n=1 Tax=uncultured Anaerotruncus sp. TaxID=905011 RepID=UPI00280AC26A|nr:hypothetical protein [uncultured Anaerotruncus sp.]